MPLVNGVDIHIRDTGDGLERNQVQLLEQLRWRFGLDGADDDILAALTAAPALVQHAGALSDAGRVAEENLETAAVLVLLLFLQPAQKFVGRRTRCGN